MDRDILKKSDEWINNGGPHENVAVSSRARLARNISRMPFATHASPEKLEEAADIINQKIQGIESLNDFKSISLLKIPGINRAYLKESHIISPEMEREYKHRFIYYSQIRPVSILINEEDHIRIQGFVAGLNLKKILNEIFVVDSKLTDELPVAFSEQLGYLTACPSNLGTGLRVSVMLHLPGLVLLKKIIETIDMARPYGLTARGFYGENSEFTGDFFQISNEVSLGKSEEEITNTLIKMILIIIEKEKKAREKLFNDQPYWIEDTIWRSFGSLTQARMMETGEAMKHLSHIRLGIDHGYFQTMSHLKLNKLIIKIQPAHLQIHEKGTAESQTRDITRAKILRECFKCPIASN
jgi:protein arginine kinase